MSCNSQISPPTIDQPKLRTSTFVSNVTQCYSSTITKLTSEATELMATVVVSDGLKLTIEKVVTLEPGRSLFPDKNAEDDGSFITESESRSRRSKAGFETAIRLGFFFYSGVT